MLYVIDGRVATSAGIASGIDLALHVIAVRHGPAAATGWPGPWWSTPGATATSGRPAPCCGTARTLSDLAHRVQDQIESHVTDRLPLTDLAAACGVNERSLTRHFEKATGATPLRYQQALRLERAEHLIGHGATVEAAARAVGFQDARMLRRLRSARPAIGAGTLA